MCIPDFTSNVVVMLMYEDRLGGGGVRKIENSPGNMACMLGDNVE